MYYTILTAIDNHGGKTFFSAADTTEKKSVDKAITNFTIGNPYVRRYQQRFSQGETHLESESLRGPQSTVLAPLG